MLCLRNRILKYSCQAVLPVPRSKRGGLTILEVLISIGVATVGLMGVLALLPLASFLAQRGLDEDAQSAVGISAIERFKIMGAADPGKWRHADGSNVTDLTTQFYCLDPRMISREGTSAQAFPIIPTVTYPTPTPPENSAAWLRMERITMVGNSPALMVSDVADFFFQTEEDLIFSPQGDSSLPPLQEYLYNKGADGEWGDQGTDDDGDTTTDNETEAGWPGTDDERIKRQSRGKVSWMAIVAPVGSDDLFKVSIATFIERDLSLDLLPGNDASLNERVAKIELADFHSGGITGGDVTLTATTTNETEREAFADIDVREGDWLLLAGNVSGIKQYAWYQVIRTDGDAKTDNEREITLFGPDWDPTLIQDTGGTQLDTYVFFFPGIVAVYEKTIRLESPSVWNNF